MFLYSLVKNLILLNGARAIIKRQDDEEAINCEIAVLKASAEAKGLSLDQYLSLIITDAVSHEKCDVRKVIALQIYANQAQEVFVAAQNRSDEAIESTIIMKTVMNPFMPSISSYTFSFR